MGPGFWSRHRAEPLLRARIVQGLEDHFHARVELNSFHVELRGGLWAEGDNSVNTKFKGLAQTPIAASRSLANDNNTFVHRLPKR